MFSFSTRTWASQETGGRIASVGHSAVYHAPSAALLVFGGYHPSSVSGSEKTNNLLVLDVETLQWTKVYLHTAL